MANSQIIIEFLSVPTAGEVLVISDSTNNLLYSETFRVTRNVQGEVTIPVSSRGTYHMVYSSTASINDIGVSLEVWPGIYETIFLSQAIAIDNGNGTITAVVQAVATPQLIYLPDSTVIFWEEGAFVLFSGGSYDDFITTNYITAFNLDYNANSIFTLQEFIGSAGTGTGTVVITANDPNVQFELISKPLNSAVEIVNNNESPVFSFLPSILNFTHKQNEILPARKINISGDNWKVIGKPNFVFSSDIPGVIISIVSNGLANYQVVEGSGSALITVSLGEFYNDDVNFSPSDLAGVFEVYEDNISQGSISYSVSVTNLSSVLSIPYLRNELAYTLDTKFFEFRSQKTDTYFQFNSKIKTYDFFTDVEREFNLPLKIVLFNGFAKENVGQVIHRLMSRFTTVNQEFNQYKLATLSITCSEINMFDESVILTGTTREIPFVAGLSRGNFKNGFLEFNVKPNRVTTKSFAFLNMIISDNGFELRTFKNGILINTEDLQAPNSKVFCKKIDFLNFQKGDVIEFVIDKIGEQNTAASKKTFIVFPEGKYSNMIVWQNEFLLQSAIECTGTASIDGEGEFQSQTVYVDLVEQLEHLYSNKASKLMINTGWLLYSDIDSIESLMRSKRAWLIQGNSTIALRPMSKKLPRKDYEEELISFPLEFKINPTYNEETYSL